MPTYNLNVNGQAQSSKHRAANCVDADPHETRHAPVASDADAARPFSVVQARCSFHHA